MKVIIFQFKLFGINTYIVSDPDTNDCAIIDPGMFDEDEENILLSYIERNKLNVTHIINTHLHIDHVVGNFFATKKFNVKVLAHHKDEPLGKNLVNQARMFGLPFNMEGITISEYLKEGEVINIGKGELQVLEVPGHSQGSIALYDKKDKFVITGDALFKESIGRTDLPGGNYNELIGSIRNKLFSLPDDTVVYPGHGPSSTIGHEKLNNPFLR